MFVHVCVRAFCTPLYFVRVSLVGRLSCLVLSFLLLCLQATQLDDDNKPVLTALGFHLATLPVEPRVGKMMLYGAIFGCVEPAITIAAAMSCRNPFVAPFDK